jgi:hypothetical protein
LGSFLILRAILLWIWCLLWLIMRFSTGVEALNVLIRKFEDIFICIIPVI